MKNIFTIGQRVSTPHGMGTIDNKELANNAWPGKPVEMVETGRYGVKLDEGHTWVIKGKIAYYMPREIKAI